MATEVGLIINPVAGMGGSLGLKGTDGKLVDEAIARGACPQAGQRAIVALQQLAAVGPDCVLRTCSGPMGADAAAAAGLVATPVFETPVGRTTAEDTRRAVSAILDRKPALLLFAGGDGTARDILEASAGNIPVLGIPAGVKMHSGVFAATPRAAGEVAARFLSAREPELLIEDAEILDREASGGASPAFFGVVPVPRLRGLVPGAKASRPVAEPLAIAAALDRVAESLQDDCVSLIGPGSTMQQLVTRMGFDGTLLGIDAVQRGKLVAADLDEQAILELIRDKPSRIVVSVVGGQGFLFGRGNQQLSPAVIRRVGRDRIIVVSSIDKLTGLPGDALLVDTGDPDVDAMLAGYLGVIVSDARTVMMPVKDASAKESGN